MSQDKLRREAREALAAVTARRCERYVVPGVFRVYRNAQDEVVVEVFS